MQLDEAIRHARDVAERLRADGYVGCASEHEQLAEWLQELADRRSQDESNGVVGSRG